MMKEMSAMKMTWRDACSELRGPIEVDNSQQQCYFGIVVTYSPPSVRLRSARRRRDTAAAKEPYLLQVPTKDDFVPNFNIQDSY